MGKTVISFDDPPYTPKGWIIHEHQERVITDFNASKIILYTSKEQSRGILNGYLFREELRVGNKKVLNVNYRDYLLNNLHLVSDRLEYTSIFFWGTIYIDNEGIFQVPYLSSSSHFMGKQYRDFRPKCQWLDMLGNEGGFPAAVYED